MSTDLFWRVVKPDKKNLPKELKYYLELNQISYISQDILKGFLLSGILHEDPYLEDSVKECIAAMEAGEEVEFKIE